MPQRDQEIALLRREIELMMGERQALLRVEVLSMQQEEVLPLLMAIQPCIPKTGLPIQ
jgi:hypothetical protein